MAGNHRFGKSEENTNDLDRGQNIYHVTGDRG